MKCIVQLEIYTWKFSGMSGHIFKKYFFSKKFSNLEKMENYENNADVYIERNSENEDELMKDELVKMTKKALADWRVRKNRKRLRAENIKGKGLSAATSGH